MKKILMLSALLVSFFLVSAAVPGKIPVQGTLMDKDGNLISDDAAQIIFIIYDAESEGNELWREERTLFVEKGNLAVYLGEIEPVTYEKIGGQDELWLSVTYGGEEMSRIQLGSVPYAHEAQVAHNAEAVGKYTETTLDDYFSAACSEGSYLRGWSGTSPICQTDEGGESSGTTYTAGTGIIINGEVISVDQTIDLYVAGTGIDIDSGTNTISVNPSIFATTDHNHDGRYYLKSETYTKAEMDDRYHLRAGNMIIDGSENNGTAAALKVKSHTQTMLIDGNEIDSNDSLYLNNNSSNGVVVGSSSSPGRMIVRGLLEADGGISVASDESDGDTLGGLKINNSGNSQKMVFDGNEIDSNSELHLNYNSKNAVHIGGDLKVYDSTGTVGWKKPIKIVRYTSLGNNVNRKTDFRHDEWCASIAGFNTGTMDIDESADGDVKVYLYKSNDDYWHIVANIANDDPGEDWMIKVMFMRKEIADCSGDS
jgi:hypothetical protein